MGFFSKIKNAISYINQPVQPTFLHLMIGGVVIGVTAIATYQLPSLLTSYFKTPEPEPKPIEIIVESAGKYVWSIGGALVGVAVTASKRLILDKISDLATSTHHKIANTRLGSMLPTWALPKRQQNPEHVAILKPLAAQLMKFNPDEPTKVSFAINMNEINIDELCEAPFAVGIDGHSRRMFEIRLVKDSVETSVAAPQLSPSKEIEGKKRIPSVH